MIKLMMVIIIIGKKRNRQNTLRTLGNLEIRKWVGQKIRIRKNARIQIVITITITSTPTPTLRIGRVPSSPLVLKTLADDSAPVQLLRDFPRLGAIIFFDLHIIQNIIHNPEHHISSNTLTHALRHNPEHHISSRTKTHALRICTHACNLGPRSDLRSGIGELRWRCSAGRCGAAETSCENRSARK